MKIAIVHDSPVATGLLRRAVTSERGWTVAWTAATAAEAVAHQRAAAAEAVLLGLSLPDATECVRRLREEARCPVVIVCPAPDLAVSGVYAAMMNGAAGAIALPTVGPSGELAGAERVVQRLRSLQMLDAPVTPLPVMLANPPLVALGASTGGPEALARILGGLPRTLPAAVLIVQHVDSDYSPGLATWLEERTGFPVALATNGDRPRAGAALLAGTRDHLVMSAERSLTYRSDPKKAIHRPSIDVLFESLVPHGSRRCVAALLTGMGRDGAAGLKRLRDVGWLTISQDEQTSAVFGMPKAAAESGAARLVLPIDRIAAAILDHCAPGSAPEKAR